MEAEEHPEAPNEAPTRPPAHERRLDTRVVGKLLPPEPTRERVEAIEDCEQQDDAQRLDEDLLALSEVIKTYANDPVSREGHLRNTRITDELS